MMLQKKRRFKMNLDTQVLIQWFHQNKRDLPWRHTHDPYAIWISEIMLQQTRVDTVIPYYLKFLKKLPTIKDLANVSDEELYKLWEGLGYYSRAKNLKTSAQMIVKNFSGAFPKQYADALTLKGIGEYSAGAILSRAFQAPYACVDGNVLRVLSRYLTSSLDIALSSTKKYFKQQLEQLSPSNWGDFNESLMELGATICTFKSPKCDLCPLKNQCLAYQNQTIDQFPVNTKKLEVKTYPYTCIFLQYQQSYYFEIKHQGVLKDLFSPILIEGTFDENEVKDYLKTNFNLCPISIQHLPKQKHIFTHQIWQMNGYLVQIEKIPHLLKSSFYSIKQIQTQITIPICFQKFFPFLKINVNKSYQ